jgi:hypothetical protein
MSEPNNQGAATAAARTLYEISVDYSDIEQLMESIDIDEISEQDESRIAQFIADLAKERDKKFDNCGGFIQSQTLLGESQVAEGKRMLALGTSKLNKAKYLKQRLLGFMQFHKVDKPIHTERFRFSRAGNGGKMPVRLSADAENNPVELPERYRRVTYSPHLDNIREDLERLAEIEKVFGALAAIGEMERMEGVVNLRQSHLSEDEQAAYDQHKMFVDSLGKAFIERATKYTADELAEFDIEKRDLESLLNGVGELGERGEHLRIA